MPELPEIETIKNGIFPFVVGQEIKTVILHRHDLRWPIPKQLAKILCCQTVNALERRGKYLLFRTNLGTLITHLGMSGQLTIQPAEHACAKHEHVNIVFTNGYALCLIDPRRFGAVLWTDKDPLQHKLLKSLGPEPLTPGFSGEYLFNLSRRSKAPIKQFIMNAKNVVGVGNIYANEALFAAKLHPLQPANTITREHYEKLAKAIKLVLKFAIKHGGTTIKDYVNSSGKKGAFQNKLKVYGKHEQTCPCCRTKLQLLRVGQRATVFCPSCQQFAREPR